MNERWIALLGRCDKPTDAVEDYCRYLGEALGEHGIELRLERVEWNADGWPAALRELRQRAAAWRDRWILVQYTALAWSARGFPRRFVRVLRDLGGAGARVGVVFHDVEPYSGERVIDKLRQRVQIRTMRNALELADAAIFTVPPEKISWKPRQLAKASFIPVGANLPVTSERLPRATAETRKSPIVAVFGITGGATGERETREILGAVRYTAQRAGAFRLAVFGRHAEEREAALREGLRDVPVEVSVEGVLDGRQVVEKLRASDALLFVRGGISTRRSSAIAGIACGLPVIARAGSETAAPIREAGVAFYSEEKENELGAVLARVLEDADYRAMLAEKSRRAYDEHFSWSAIAKKYVHALRPGA
jgi:glycosyltransferase involved in cell wall biosynthesis